MQANIVDLRYKMNSVLKAIDRSEDVVILYRGKPIGIIKPIHDTEQPTIKLSDHPFFGMDTSDEPVDDVVRNLRKSRYDDL